MKKEYIFIGITSLVALSIIILGFFVFFQDFQHAPTPVPGAQTPTPSTTSLVPSVTSGADRLVEKVTNRQQLSALDVQAKNTILQTTSGESGVIKKTELYTVDYVKAADLFQVEIETTAIKEAKAQAVAWFLSQKLSQEAICNLPIQFYLNFSVTQQLRNSNTPIDLNPLPEGC